MSLGRLMERCMTCKASTMIRHVCSQALSHTQRTQQLAIIHRTTWTHLWLVEKVDQKTCLLRSPCAPTASLDRWTGRASWGWERTLHALWANRTLPSRRSVVLQDLVKVVWWCKVNSMTKISLTWQMIRCPQVSMHLSIHTGKRPN